MKTRFKTTIKEKNIFWSGVQVNAILGLIVSVFAGSFLILMKDFVIVRNFSELGLMIIMFLIFINSGASLLICSFYAKNKIIPTISSN